MHVSLTPDQAVTPMIQASVQSDQHHSGMSPALLRAGDAFERKYLVTPEISRDIIRWAHRHLPLDRHVQSDDGYPVQTLYLDTPGFDIYRRLGRFAGRKYRIRRYGEEAAVWLEEKRKKSGRVCKQRTQHANSILESLSGLTSHTPGSEDWFHHSCLDYQLGPVCEVTYWRLAWGADSSGPIRLTLDQRIAARRTGGWQVSQAAEPATPILTEGNILELKYCETMPTLFRILIQDFQLEPTSFSKYRTAVDGVVTARISAGQVE